MINATTRYVLQIVININNYNNKYNYNYYKTNITSLNSYYNIDLSFFPFFISFLYITFFSFSFLSFFKTRFDHFSNPKYCYYSVTSVLTETFKY